MGKSSILSAIGEKYGEKIDVVYEKVDEWTDLKGINLLDKFYKNPAENCFQVQSYIQLSMLKSELAPTAKKIQVFERSIHSSIRIFARLALKKQNMTSDQYHILEEWSKFLVSTHKTLQPNLI